LHYAAMRLTDGHAKMSQFGKGDDSFYEIKDLASVKYATAEIAPDDLAQVPAGTDVMATRPADVQVIEADSPAFFDKNNFTFPMTEDGKHGLDGIKVNNPDRADDYIINKALEFAYAEGVNFSKYMKSGE